MLLAIFAFLAGIATVLSPCIIPVLPALLSAGVGKGRLRPIGIVFGVIVSFTFFTLALKSLVDLFGISANVLRYAAIIMIGLFGVVMLIPRLSDWFARITSSFADVGSSIQSSGKKEGSGFFAGFIIGVSLGLVWTPCAGPILAAVTTLVATTSVNSTALLLTLSYSLGAALPMFLIVYGGNRVIHSSRFFASHAEGIRQGFGVLMIVSALVLGLQLDTYFNQFVVEKLPFLQVDNNPYVKEELSKLQKNDNSPLTKETAIPVSNEKPKTQETSVPVSNVKRETQETVNPSIAPTLPIIAKAPEIVGIENWINSPPLSIDQLRGKVVLIDFWTYSCINCIRTLPYTKSWYEKYKDKGFVLIGVHTPEFEFEKSSKNVEDAVKRFGITYPVAQDNQFKTWIAYHNSFWPAHYLIDQQGQVREVHFGEGAYVETENAIRSLLGEPPLKMEEVAVSTKPLTSETYLGLNRADHYASDVVLKPNRVSSYNYKSPLAADHVGLTGEWLVEPESITSKGPDAILDINFQAENVYLVIGGKSSKPIQVLMDGKPIPKEYLTADMNAEGEIVVDDPRKYDLVNLKGHYGRHLLTLQVPEGIILYAFTFGD